MYIYLVGAIRGEIEGFEKRQKGRERERNWTFLEKDKCNVFGSLFLYKAIFSH